MSKANFAAIAYAAALFTALGVPQAKAGEWTEIGTTDDYTVWYVDIDTFAEIGDTKSIWVRVIPPKLRKFSYTEIKYWKEINCRNLHSRSLYTVVYWKQKPTQTFNPKSPPWKPVVPGTMIDTLKDLLCYT